MSTSICVSNPSHSVEKSSFLSSIQSWSSAAFNRSVQSILWLIQNRGGFSFLTGQILVPAQHMCRHASASQAVIEHASRSNLFRIESFETPLADGTKLKGVICYPKNWKPHDRSRCILYHNPNAMVIADFLDFSECAPLQLFKKSQCPLIMYDYRGTGLSSENTMGWGLKFRATNHSVIEDGCAALKFACDHFENVTTAGSSLGGAVATVSLADYENSARGMPLPVGRIRLINHDSFTTTGHVVFPAYARLANWIFWAVGAYIDAAAPMKKLVNQQNIPITVLCHQNDPIIPRGAQMAEMVESMSTARNVSVIYSQDYGHADLSSDMLRGSFLKKS